MNNVEILGDIIRHRVFIKLGADLLTLSSFDLFSTWKNLPRETHFVFAHLFIFYVYSPIKYLLCNVM